MPLIAYIDKAPQPATLALIQQANEIIAEYAVDGYQLTLRQLYYQFVARDLIPNTQKSYKRLGSVVSDGRMLGLIDWDAISDRLRELRAPAHWDNPGEIIQSAAGGYRRDLWVGQEYRPEIWVEKDALGEVVDRAASELRVPVMVCRGYMSQSAIWESGHGRLRRWVSKGYTPVVIHLGDHDPSGLDMTRDIQARLQLFSRGDVIVERIALNMDQVEQYEPPPNPAKITDSRSAAYIAEHGNESWELDALEPRVLHDLIQGAIDRYRNVDLYEALERVEQDEREELRRIADDYDGVRKYLSENDDRDPPRRRKRKS